ncbi:SecDF P1 head subdomain-containing protein [Actinokineospora fastidiosa]|uniref:SecDF P1 head subdomain-containing protein n=1 Tax=Actinokineospora fastidiosa TaxID=1816 RepID=UPI0016703A36|nr:hypothetical protein [Actinokineospora fastidiosa]
MARAWWAVVAAGVVLTGCQSTVDGGAVREAALEFRPVVVSYPTNALTPGVTSSACPGKAASADKACRQSADLAPAGSTPADPAAQMAALNALDCGGADPLDADPALPLAACDRDGVELFILDKAFLDERHVAEATSGIDPQGVGYVVTLSFTAEGTDIWARHTESHVNERVAFLVDGKVVSAPTIQGAIHGDTTIHGGVNGFTRDEAENLVAALGG